MSVTYKQIGEGCNYTINPLMSGAGEILSIDRSKKRESAKSGLLLKCDVVYPLGSLIQLDIKFPGQENTYRAKGIVSWRDENDHENVDPIGITITGMDKLDKYGISVSIAAKIQESPALPSVEPSAWIIPSAEDAISEPETEDEFDENDDQLDESQEPSETDDEFGLRGSFVDKTTDVEPEETPPAQEYQFTKTSVIMPETMEDTIQPEPLDSFKNEEPRIEPEKVIKSEPQIIEKPMLEQVEDMLEQSSDDNIESDETVPSDSTEQTEEPKNEIISYTTPTFNKIISMFGILSSLFPEKLFNESVFIDEFFITPDDKLPPKIKSALESPTTSTYAKITAQDHEPGIVGISIAKGQSGEAPPIFLIEELIRRHTKLPVNSSSINNDEATLEKQKCIARIGSSGSPVKAVLSMDASMLDLLCNIPEEPKKSPPFVKIEPIIISKPAEDITQNVNLPISQDKEESRKSIPVPARVSELPPAYITDNFNDESRMSMEIDTLLADAFESMHDLSSFDTKEGASDFTLDVALRLISCEGACLTLVAPDKFELYIASTGGIISKELKERRLSASEGIAGFCMRNSKVIRTKSPEMSQLAIKDATNPIYDVMSAPIVDNHMPIGTIELYNCKSTTGFTIKKADLLAYIARSLGEFISHTLVETEKK